MACGFAPQAGDEAQRHPKQGQEGPEFPSTDAEACLVSIGFELQNIVFGKGSKGAISRCSSFPVFWFCVL